MPIRLIIIVSLILSIVWACSTTLIENPENIKQNDSVFEIVILPHHGITGKKIDEFYENIKKEFSQFDRIVIVSPDHYGTTNRDIESLPITLNQVCYAGHCV